MPASHDWCTEHTPEVIATPFYPAYRTKRKPKKANAASRRPRGLVFELLWLPAFNSSFSGLDGILVLPCCRMAWVNDCHGGEEDTSHYIITMQVLLQMLHVQFSTFSSTAPAHTGQLVARDVIDLVYNCLPLDYPCLSHRGPRATMQVQTLEMSNNGGRKNANSHLLGITLRHWPTITLLVLLGRRKLRNHS